MICHKRKEEQHTRKRQQVQQPLERQFKFDTKFAKVSP